ncbi:hypothetical protein PN466_00810 [Roseofilum reptotaenium CS-1145]|uniref:Uncharacterized protein n=1 Tax=Roseofilum reptotaenium AO1-A TaxID=1925591 RepID=A0A1L9QKP0_9CYAN|nr:hypothetical protein [Roseofilum reptotaenium]MDB9515502.1 hypothetical protein [Roseofilum reptotaenium CS-1145]OJJ16939.1 hypothetical protein BI308_23270 [Roseofilum reptotaenium AO1-A]
MAKYNVTLAMELEDLMLKIGFPRNLNRREVLDYALHLAVDELRHQLLQEEINKGGENEKT